MLKKRSPPPPSNKVFNPSTVYGFSNICIFKKKKFSINFENFQKTENPQIFWNKILILKSMYFREIIYLSLAFSNSLAWPIYWRFSHQKYLGQTKVANRCYRSFLSVKFIIPLKACPSDIPTVINRRYWDHRVHSPFSLGFFYQMIFLHLSSSLDCLARNASRKLSIATYSRTEGCIITL